MSYARKFFLKALVVVLAVGFIPLSAYPVQGQEGIALEGAGASVNFGKTITFHARVKTPLPIKQLTLIFRGVNQQATYAESVQAAEDGSVNFVYDASLNIIPPFSKVVFWFQATLTDDVVYTSSMTEFPYQDDRFPWKDMTRANVTVYWYAGDDAFGAAALDAAGAGLLAMQEFVPVSLTDPIYIYIYSNATDLQNILPQQNGAWVGGHAVTESGVVLVAVAPDSSQAMMMQTKIPHELTHVLLYRALGGQYANQPIWLLEGISSMMETYPNPDYQHALGIASREGSLIPFTSLCESFPRDSGSVYLAYAQSQSFVSYIRKTHGASGLAYLTKIYGDGLNCELGATKALGTPLSQLDARWREDVLGQNVIGVAARNLSPFLLILALVLIVPLWGTIDLLRQRRRRVERRK